MTYSPEGAGFAISSVQNAVLGGEIDLTWAGLVHTYIDNGSSCDLFEYPAEGSYLTGYQSLIGDTSIQQTAPITLQDMLNNGTKRSNDVVDSVSGFRTVQLAIPEDVIPWGVVQSVQIHWSFTHIKQKPEGDSLL